MITLSTALVGCAPDQVDQQPAIDQMVAEAPRLLLPDTIPSQDTVTPEPVPTEEALVCVANGEASIGGVSLFDRGAQALARIGAPESSVRDSSEDDGGTYEFIRYRFRGLEVEVDPRWDRIQRIATDDSAMSGPFGVRVGMAAGEVQRRLGAPQHPEKPGRWELRVCAKDEFSNGTEFLQLHFRGVAGPFDAGRDSMQAPRVSSIELTNYGI